MAETNFADAILIADGDNFESGYVLAALEAAGLPVVGPLRSAGDVELALAGGTSPRAVVLANRLSDGPTWALAERLRERGIAHLVLIGPPWDGDSVDPPGISVLRKPFGAYQVVEWASQFAACATPLPGQPAEVPE